MQLRASIVGLALALLSLSAGADSNAVSLHRTDRTLEELQQTFNGASGAIFKLFQAYTADFPKTKQGRIVVSLTIEPSGLVSDCHVVTSNLNSKLLEAAIVANVRLLTFGTRDTPQFTYPNYPITFRP